PFAVASQVTVNPVLMSLIHGNVEIKSVELNQPKLEVVRNQQGVWKFSTLGQPTAPPQPATQPPQPTPAQKPAAAQPSQPQTTNQPEKAQQRQFALDSLKINVGQVGVTDLQKRQARAVYDHID